MRKKRFFIKTCVVDKLSGFFMLLKMKYLQSWNIIIKEGRFILLKDFTKFLKV